MYFVAIMIFACYKNHSGKTDITDRKKYYTERDLGDVYEGPKDRKVNTVLSRGMMVCG